MSSSASRSCAAVGLASRLGDFGGRAAAVPERPVHVDADVPRRLPLVLAREDPRDSGARSRSRPTTASDGSEPAPRRVDARAGGVRAQRERLRDRRVRRAPPSRSQPAARPRPAARARRQPRTSASSGAPISRASSARAESRWFSASMSSDLLARDPRLDGEDVVRRQEPGVEPRAHVR